MRARAAVVMVAAFALLAGCGQDAAETASAASPAPARQPPAAGPSAAPQATPAGAAGGACYLLDYAETNPILGIDFAVAAAAQRDQTFTCALQPRGASFPDLVLAVTATTVDPAVYAASVRPKNASNVTGLGKVAYSVAVPASASAGAGVEVGWLAGNGRLMMLRVRFAPDASPPPSAEVLPRLVELAKRVDQSSL